MKTDQFFFKAVIYGMEAMRCCKITAQYIWSWPTDTLT